MNDLFKFFSKKKNITHQHKLDKPARNHSKKVKSEKKQEQLNWDIKKFNVPIQKGLTRFHDFNLSLALMRSIYELGFQYCTPIQNQLLKCTLSGQDAIGQAQTGTGKTAAFLISSIQQLLEIPAPDQRYIGEPRVVIIAPTRELALQIGKDANALTKYLPYHVVTIVGGMNYETQKKAFQKQFVDILVATPGRLLDFCQNKDVFLDLTEVLIIDEADRMLDMGFIPQIRRVIRMMPRAGDRQTLLLSATFTDNIIRLSEQWTWKATRIEVETKTVISHNIEQKIYIVTNDKKYVLLKKLLQDVDVKSLIVFSNTREQTRNLTKKLSDDGFLVEALSGEISQSKRLKTLENFKKGLIKVLVATDVAGRGIHVDGVSHVVNYTLPENPEDYIHRIGRTGRAGMQGTSISFASEDDSFLIPELEGKLNMKLKIEYPPSDLI